MVAITMLAPEPRHHLAPQLSECVFWQCSFQNVSDLFQCRVCLLVLLCLRNFRGLEIYEFDERFIEPLPRLTQRWGCFPGRNLKGHKQSLFARRYAGLLLVQLLGDCGWLPPRGGSCWSKLGRRAIAKQLQAAMKSSRNNDSIARMASPIIAPRTLTCDH